MADTTRSQIAHLYRRAGFGARPDELDAATARGYEATVNQLIQLNGPDPAADAVAPPTFGNASQPPPSGVAARQALNQELRREGAALVSWWLQRMVVTANPLREKLTLLWHGHFATAITKVKLAELMYRQNQLLRTMGSGNFETLVQAVAKDPAMMVWLDSNSNSKGHPNENFARELMELFTLGIGNYTEDDVKAGARCFTGWAYDRRSDAFAFQSGRHDDGPKVFLGQTGNFGGEDVIHMVTGSPASARWVTSRLWSLLGYPVAPDDPLVKDLAVAYAKDLDVTGLLRAMFLRPEFLSAQARQGLVKQPVEYVVGALRSFGGKADNPALLGLLNQLGQVPFDPPSVGGWPPNTYWLTTATSLSRLNFAAAVAAALPAAPRSALDGASATDRPAALAHLLGIDGWSRQTADALAKAPSTTAMVTLGLVAPEYILN